MALPSGYTELTYIQSNGSQYIDTEFTPNQDTRVDMVFEAMSVEMDASLPYGAAINALSQTFECYVENELVEFNYNNTYQFTSCSVAAGDKLTISQNKNNASVTVNGKKHTASFTYSSFTAPYTLTLFALNRPDFLCGSGRIYSCQIYNNGTLVRDFIPCKNASGTVGMWDDKNSKFYGNAGSGTFTAGATVSGGGSSGGETSGTYTVNISGSLNSSYAYATIAGTKTTTTGTKTYTSKPTVAVYVSSSRSSLRSSCKVTLNGETVKSGYGSYTADIGDADTVNIQFNAVKSGSYTYYTCDITTEKSSSGGDSGGDSGGGGHCANVNGTTYDIEGGTARLSGVGYEIESGMTLVNGVAYEIGFSKRMFTLTISGYGHATYDYVRVNGATYTGGANATTLELEEGTEVYTYCNAQANHTLNGNAINAKEHTFNISSDTSIYMYYASQYNNGVEITTQ